MCRMGFDESNLGNYFANILESYTFIFSNLFVNAQLPWWTFMCAYVHIPILHTLSYQQKQI